MIARHLAGDPEAFELVYLRSFPRLSRVFARYMGSKTIAENIA